MISLFLLSIPLPNKAQTVSDQEKLLATFAPAPKKAPYEFAHKVHDNEYSWGLAQLFVGYKKYVSSQDLGVCNFPPSCSEYAMISVRKMGVVKGVLNGFDRLTRCHPGAYGHYEWDFTHKKLQDPVLLYK
jgi:hypothetical protein